MMKRSKKISLLTLLAVIISFLGCETNEKIDDFPLRPSKLVLNSFFSADSIWEFQVSKSLSVLDNAEIKLVRNAQILLFKGDDLIDTVDNSKDDGWYRLNTVLPEPGNPYRIEIKAPGFSKTLTASDYVPESVPVSDINATITDSTFFEYYDYGNIIRYGNVEANVALKFHDPPGANYYKIAIFSYDTVYYYYNEDSTSRDVVMNILDVSSDDPVITGTTNNTLLFTDEIFDGQDYRLRLNIHDWNAVKGKRYTIRLTSLTRAGYLYRLSLINYNQVLYDPFSEPVQVYSNIENGYGIFAGYNDFYYEFVLF